MMLLARDAARPHPGRGDGAGRDVRRGLGVGDDMMQVVRRFANGSLGLALIDFERSGYFQELLAEPPEHLHTSQRVVGRVGQGVQRRPPCYEQWAALEDCPDGSLGSGRVALLPRPRLHVPGSTRQRAAEPRAARLDPRARRLRLDRGVGDRGVRPHRPLQRRSAGVLAARDGARPVRDRLPLRRRQGLLRVRPRVTSRATSTAWRCGSPTRCTAGRCSPGTSTTPTRAAATDLLATDWFAHADRPLDEVRAELRAPAAVRRGSRRGFDDGVGAGRHLAVPVRARARGRGGRGAASTTRTAPNPPENLRQWRAGARSSADQSIGLLIRRSKVRILPGAHIATRFIVALEHVLRRPADNESDGGRDARRSSR